MQMRVHPHLLDYGQFFPLHFPQLLIVLAPQHAAHHKGQRQGEGTSTRITVGHCDGLIGSLLQPLLTCLLYARASTAIVHLYIRISPEGNAYLISPCHPLQEREECIPNP
eukprot:1147425-Pelagomonas_calceolata.AAC.1